MTTTTTRTTTAAARRAEITAASSWIHGVSWKTTAPGIGTVTIETAGRSYVYAGTALWRYAALWRSARCRGLGAAVHAVWFGDRSGKPRRFTSRAANAHQPKPEPAPPEQDLTAALTASIAVAAAA